jgi:hypothetical protein
MQQKAPDELVRLERHRAIPECRLGACLHKCVPAPPGRPGYPLRAPALKRPIVKLGSTTNAAFAAVRASSILPRCARAAASDRREREIAVDIDGATKPRDRFFIFPEMQLGGAGAAHPVMCCDIAGGAGRRDRRFPGHARRPRAYERPACSGPLAANYTSLVIDLSPLVDADATTSRPSRGRRQACRRSQRRVARSPPGSEHRRCRRQCRSRARR